MDLEKLMAQAHDSLTVRKAFGDPFERDGVTVIPAAAVRGGAGGGRGNSPDRTGEGSGGGFGLVVRPTGAFVIKDGNVTWRPAVDVNRVILGGQIVAIVALLTLRKILTRRRR